MGMKKLAALVMALVLCLFAVSAMAEVVDVYTDEEFAAAVANSDVTVINVKEDILYGSGVVFWTSKVVNFNGHTYNFAKNPSGDNTPPTLGFQVRDAAESVVMNNGKITSTKGSGVLRLIQNYTNLTLNDMTLDGSNLDPHSDGTPNIVVSFNNGTSTVDGKTSIKANAGDLAFDTWDYYKNGVNLTVNTTGKIEGNIEVGGEAGSTKKPVLTIKNVGSDSKIDEIVVGKGDATLYNLPVGTSIENNGSGTVTANGVNVGDVAYVIPAPAPVGTADLPQTGDNTSLMLWASMLALAAVGFVASKKVRFN